ncbi:hypothetical protein [Bacillus marinisedimentorum]|uniref:hypothetical protein n=1 Tax=Bacillus marinisedimentorum TaxID=1821260 RepID=UPI0007DEA8BA|nr:hypothetical protein [Bacillus marinisedimentorum]
MDSDQGNTFLKTGLILGLIWFLLSVSLMGYCRNAGIQLTVLQWCVFAIQTVTAISFSVYYGVRLFANS